MCIYRRERIEKRQLICNEYFFLTMEINNVSCNKSLYLEIHKEKKEMIKTYAKRIVDSGYNEG